MRLKVAAAMAAEVARAPPRIYVNRGRICEKKEVQLLLAVQNVAVKNIGEALKKMDYGGGEVISMLVLM